MNRRWLFLFLAFAVALATVEGASLRRRRRHKKHFAPAANALESTAVPASALAALSGALAAPDADGAVDDVVEGVNHVVGGATGDSGVVSLGELGLQGQSLLSKSETYKQDASMSLSQSQSQSQSLNAGVQANAQASVEGETKILLALTATDAPEVVEGVDGAPDVEVDTESVEMDTKGKIVIPQPREDSLVAPIAPIATVAPVTGSYSLLFDRFAVAVFGALIVTSMVIFEEDRLERKKHYKDLANELDPSVLGVTMLVAGSGFFILSMFLVSSTPWELFASDKAIAEGVCWTIICTCILLMRFSPPDTLRYFGALAVLILGWLCSAVLTGLDSSLTSVPSTARMGYSLSGFFFVLLALTYYKLHRFKMRVFLVYTAGSLFWVLGWFLTVYSQCLGDNTEYVDRGSKLSILGLRFEIGLVGLVMMTHGFNTCETSKDSWETSKDKKRTPPMKGLFFYVGGWALFLLSAWLQPQPSELAIPAELFGVSLRAGLVLTAGALVCGLHVGNFYIVKQATPSRLDWDDTNKGAVVDWAADNNKRIWMQVAIPIAWFTFSLALSLNITDGEVSIPYFILCSILSTAVITGLHMFEKLRLDAHRPEYLFNFAHPLYFAALLSLNLVNAINR